MTRFLVSIILVLMLPLAVQAQEAATEPEAEIIEPAPAAPVEPIAPYDDKLLRLAEVLGSVHYLRALCGAKEGSQWRDAMSKIIGSEKPGPKRRARMVAHFNRGYRAFDGVYGTCTPSAHTASQRYMQEGIALTTQITGRYGR